MQTFQLILGLAAAFVLLVAFALFGNLISLAVQCRLSGVPVSFRTLVRWKMSKIDSRVLVYGSIRARKTGIGVSLDALESHYVAGGRVPNCISALIAARKAGLDVSWDEVAAWDLSGTDPFQAIGDIINQPDR